MRRLLPCVFAFVFALWAQGELVVNEIMYNPPGIDQEWVELYNITDGDVVLDSTWILTDGEGRFNFPGFTVPAGGFVTVIVDTYWSGDTVVPFEPDIDATGHGIKLANGGDDVILLHIVDGDTVVVDSVTYSPDWAPESNSGGSSLERIDPYGDSNDPSNWQASAVPGGTPGAPNKVAEKSLRPKLVSLRAAPNPFNCRCVITAATSEPATITITDIRGRVVCRWSIPSGTNQITWSPNVPSGVYVVTAAAGGAKTNVRVLLVR